MNKIKMGHFRYVFFSQSLGLVVFLILCMMSASVIMKMLKMYFINVNILWNSACFLCQRSQSM